MGSQRLSDFQTFFKVTLSFCLILTEMAFVTDSSMFCIYMLLDITFPTGLIITQITI